MEQSKTFSTNVPNRLINPGTIEEATAFKQIFMEMMSHFQATRQKQAQQLTESDFQHHSALLI